MNFSYSNWTVFVLGLPRSGTTWLAKMLDSHPGVLYRHEPDIVRRSVEIPTMCEPAQAERYVEATREWLNLLARTRRLKSAGPFPIFRKSYHTALEAGTRKTFVTMLKLVDQVPATRRLARAIAIPDFVDLDSDACHRLVIKSISALGRAGLIARAAPESRFVLMLRHPCGQIDLILRGEHLEQDTHLDGAMVDSLAGTVQARRRNLGAAQLAALPPLAQLAWSWLIHNEKAIEELGTAAHFKTVRHGDLAGDPHAEGRDLFAFCGLDWGPQTASFVEASRQASGDEGYYDVKRNPEEATMGWRRRLTPAQIETIAEIVADSLPGRLFSFEKEREPLKAVNSN